MNISILKDKCFQTNFYEFWTRINAHPLRSSDVTRWWEKVFKPGLKILTIRYCKHKAAERRSRGVELYEKLTEVTNQLCSGREGYELFLKVKRELIEWERDMVKGCKIRAGKVVDEGHDRVTTFHINAERERTVNSKIEQLEVDGRVLVGKDGVAEGLLQHFKSVFQRGENTNSSGREGFLVVIRERVNMEGDRQDGVISMDELKFALERTKKDKSPGIDGISYEFYIEFFQTVGPTMVEMMNMSIRRRKLEKSQGLAVIKRL